VAASTVSRYHNGQLKLTPATRPGTADAVASLGYWPNVQAKNLARRQFRPSASWWPEMSNPYLGAIADPGAGALIAAVLMCCILLDPQPGVTDSSLSTRWRPVPRRMLLPRLGFRSAKRLLACVDPRRKKAAVGRGGRDLCRPALPEDTLGGMMVTTDNAAITRPDTTQPGGARPPAWEVARFESCPDREHWTSVAAAPGYCDALVQGRHQNERVHTTT